MHKATQLNPDLQPVRFNKFFTDLTQHEVEWRTFPLIASRSMRKAVSSVSEDKSVAVG
jgi:hypothetical protein